MNTHTTSSTKTHTKSLLVATLSVLFIGTGIGTADPYEITWFTIDNGGGVSTAPAGYSLSATIGQPDAGSAASPMTGGGYALLGGFWSSTDSCAMPGDVNFDGRIDGRDIQNFVTCITGGGNCLCADVDGGGVGPSDMPAFIAALLGA